MMNLAPRERAEICAFTDGVTLCYCGSIPFSGRELIEGSELIQVRNKGTKKVVFEGRPNKAGSLQWTRLSGAPLGSMNGTWNPVTGQWMINFDTSGAAKDEEIVFFYSWQPHHLHGAEVMVKLNGEERLVPLIELQKALFSYLGDE